MHQLVAWNHQPDTPSPSRCPGLPHTRASSNYSPGNCYSPVPILYLARPVTHPSQPQTGKTVLPDALAAFTSLVLPPLQPFSPVPQIGKAALPDDVNHAVHAAIKGPLVLQVGA